jgi:hypothetical protein
LTVGGRLPKHPSVSQLTSRPDSVLSKCRRSRHPIPTQIATAPAQFELHSRRRQISDFAELESELVAARVANSSGLRQ